MCFGARNKNEDGEARSREVEKILRQDEKRMAKEVKLLLLGKPWMRCVVLPLSFIFPSFPCLCLDEKHKMKELYRT